MQVVVLTPEQYLFQVIFVICAGTILIGGAFVIGKIIDWFRNRKGY